MTGQTIGQVQQRVPRNKATIGQKCGQWRTRDNREVSQIPIAAYR